MAKRKKSLGQICFEEFQSKLNPSFIEVTGLSRFIGDWERAATAVEREVLKRLKPDWEKDLERSFRKRKAKKGKP